MKTINFGGKEFNDQDTYAFDGSLFKCRCTFNDCNKLEVIFFHERGTCELDSNQVERVLVMNSSPLPNAKLLPISGKYYQFGDNGNFSDITVIEAFDKMSGSDFVDMLGYKWKYCRPVPQEIRKDMFGEAE